MATYLRVVGERVQSQLGELFRVLDVLEVVVAQRAVRVSGFQQDVRPVGGRGILEEQEGLARDVTQGVNRPTGAAEPRVTFQQTDLHPAIQGLEGPLNLTARWRSAKLELALSVASHRLLVGR